MESNPLKSLFCFLFSPIIVQQKGNYTNNSEVKHPWGEGRRDSCMHGIWYEYTCCFGWWLLTTPLFSFLSNGTSMISLIIPPKDQISRVAKMLADEFGTASNIKSRVNRLSVLGAITSVQQRLKLYNKGNF